MMATIQAMYHMNRKANFLFFLFSLLFLDINGQSVLNYNKRFVECEDKWVALNATKDSSHPYGFIYIDAMAGLTLHYEGNFIIDENGKFVVQKLMDNGAYKVRLEANNVNVAIIPASRYSELNITDPPDWLHNYKTTSDSIGRMVRWGYFYNHWGESAKALTFLEKAYQLDPGYKGIAFELSYAYNALEQFDKAIPVLEKAIAANPEECLLYKELSFTQIFLNQLDKAGESCHKGIKHCEDKKMKAEIAYNLAYTYFIKKDKTNFDSWASETKKWADPGERFSNNIALMEKEINK